MWIKTLRLNLISYWGKTFVGACKEWKYFAWGRNVNNCGQRIDFISRHDPTFLHHSSHWKWCPCPHHLLLTRGLGPLQPEEYGRSNAVWLPKLGQKGICSFHLLLLEFLLLDPSHHAMRKPKLPYGKIMPRYLGQLSQFKSKNNTGEWSSL